MTHKNCKLIFLDIDGVMNSEESNFTHGRGDIFCEQAVEALNQILHRTGAKIVISSSWREMYDYPDMERVLVYAGVKAQGKVIGQTPSWNLSRKGHILGAYQYRGQEIFRYLQDFDGIVEGIAILDDTADMAFMTPWFIQTDWKVGLQVNQVADVIRMLNTPFCLREPQSELVYNSDAAGYTGCTV